LATGTALVVTLVVMTAVNVWFHVGPPRTHLVIGPAAALFLLLVARTSGLSWAELGLSAETAITGARYAAVTAAIVAATYCLGVMIPATRGAFRDTRYRMRASSAVYTASLVIPLATVVFEEVAFRGVLWGLMAHDHGEFWATGASSLIFGVWHVLPALVLARANSALRAGGTRVWSRMVVTVLGTVILTTAAGVVFGELRRLTGSLVAPAGVHWATNGLGVLAAAWVWARWPNQPEQDPAANR
jgi:membrane protease YdiL (CAAX protease family)